MNNATLPFFKEFAHSVVVFSFLNEETDTRHGIVCFPECNDSKMYKPLVNLLSTTIQSNIEPKSILFWRTHDNIINQFTTSDEVYNAYLTKQDALLKYALEHISTLNNGVTTVHSIHFNTIQEILGGETQFITHNSSFNVKVEFPKHYSLFVDTCERMKNSVKVMGQ